MSWEALVGRGVDYTPSAAESARFGVSVARVTVLSEDAASAATRLAEVLRTASEDVLIVRYPAAEIALGAVLAASGRDVIPAGALTYWSAPVADVVATVGPTELDVITSDHWDSGLEALISEVVGQSFTDYRNHYSANPLFDPAAALAGYQEWAVHSTLAAPGSVVLLRRSREVIGLATAEVSGGDFEILLAGLVPAAQGQGLYAHLLAGCATEAGHRGLSRLVISTQVHNVRAQRAWARAGLLPFAAVETVHCVRAGLISGT